MSDGDLATTGSGTANIEVGFMARPDEAEASGGESMKIEEATQDERTWAAQQVNENTSEIAQTSPEDASTHDEHTTTTTTL